MEIKRHVGRIINTGSRVIVVFRSLPEDEDSALVVYSDSLPDFYHDNLMSVVESKEAQQNVDLYDVLNRNSFGDGNNILQTLHQKDYLVKVRVDDVNLLPVPNQPILLRTVNEEIDKANVKYEDPDKNDTPVELKAKSIEEHNVNSDDYENIEDYAKALLDKAKELEKLAKQKKEQAYSIDPSLRPKRGRQNANRTKAEGVAAQKIVDNKRKKANIRKNMMEKSETNT